VQTQNDELVVEQAKLVTEREILRRAAKFHLVSCHKSCHGFTGQSTLL
jgi:hypothetical protein